MFLIDKSKYELNNNLYNIIKKDNSFLYSNDYDELVNHELLR